jgi:PAS domain-containing protein
MEQTDLQSLVPERDVMFRATFEAAPIGMAVLGRDGRFLMVNPALLAMFACTENQLLERGLADISHPEDIDALLSRIEQLYLSQVDGHRSSWKAVSYILKTACSGAGCYCLWCGIPPDNRSVSLAS